MRSRPDPGVLSFRRTLLGAGLLVLVGGGGATAAWGAPVTEVVQGEFLRIVSVADWQSAANLLPEDVVQWDLTISADAPEPGTVSIGVSASGDAPLVVDALLCLQEWDVDECPGGATTLRAGWDLPRDDAMTALAEVADTDVARLRLSISLGDGAAEGVTAVRVHAIGAGETVTVDPSTPLPPTGLSPVVPRLLSAGAIVLVLIAVLMLVAGRRARTEDQSGEGA